MLVLDWKGIAKIEEILKTICLVWNREKIEINQLKIAKQIKVLNKHRRFPVVWWKIN